MGDPFSVASTAVGITSLGIQTFQVIARYYGQYKGFHDDIDNVLRKAEGLQGILEGLKGMKSELEIDNHAPSSQLEMELRACEIALIRPEDMAKKCNTAKTNEGMQARLRNVSKRLLWPFKKETLRDLKSSMTAFRDNLTLALHSGGLDATVRKLDDLQIRSTSIGQTLSHQGSALDTIQRGVVNLHTSQDAATALLARELVDIKSMCQLLVNSMHK